MGMEGRRGAAAAAHHGSVAAAAAVEEAQGMGGKSKGEKEKKEN